MPDVDPFPSQDFLEVEISDLDLPEHGGNPLLARLGRMFLRWQRPERRRSRNWLGNGLLLCLLLVLLGSLLNPSVGLTNLLTAHWPFTAIHAAQPSTVLHDLSLSQALGPAPHEISCPVQAAWSPDSSQVALLGYTQTCAQFDYIPAQIDLYNVATARQISHWSPDVAIMQALQSFPGVSASMENDLARKPEYVEGRSVPPFIHYTQLFWSLDQSRLALSFVAVTYVYTYVGLLLAAANGDQAQVWLQVEHDAFSPDSNTPLLWDVQHRSVTTLAPLPPALSYAWDTRDQLHPAAPLDAQTDISAYANVPPGNPVGSRTFTIWQPGRVTVLTSGGYRWSTNFAIWSPDGAYLVTNFRFSGLMEPPGQTFPAAQELNTLGVNVVPHLPVHDPALLSAVAHGQTLAWNPAGTLLAVYDVSGFVDLYDCQNGQFLQPFKVQHIAHPLFGSATLLSWSPDGRYVLLSSPQGGLLHLWALHQA